MTRRTRPARVGLAAVAALLGLLITPVAARADQIGDKQAEAQALAAQINSLGLRESALSESYDRAVLAEQQAAQAVKAAQAQVDAAQSSADAARTTLRASAINAYVRGGTNPLTASGSSLSTAQQALLRSEYAGAFASHGRDAVDQYRLAEVTAKTAEDRLAGTQRQAAADAANADAARKSVAQAQAQLQHTYSQVKGQIAVLVAQAQAARQAEQQRQAQAALAQAQAARLAQLAAQQAAAAQQQAAAVAAQQVAAPPPAAPPVSFTNPPAPTGSGGGAAVAAAMSRLGDPYVWGAAGPNTFDCSGLTMWAWAHAGVSLPHFSGAQYDATTHISMADLQPGDLVFFANPGEHEAMYIGGGRIIEAPFTGANVRIEPLYSQFVLASRP